MSLRRGFKTEANRLSLELRGELRLTPEDPLDLQAVARHLKVTIVPLSTFADRFPDAVVQLTQRDPQAWSACLLPIGPGRGVLLHNDAHAPGRQSSNIAHEFSHVLLEHPCTLPIDTTGCRVVDHEIEEEANWLGSVLLIPDAAAVYIVRRELSIDEACDRYHVSAELLRMRINLSGARRRVGRSYQS